MLKLGVGKGGLPPLLSVKTLCGLRAAGSSRRGAPGLAVAAPSLSEPYEWLSHIRLFSSPSGPTPEMDRGCV